MKKKILITLLIAIFAMSLLAGCGGNSGSSNEGKEESKTEEPANTGDNTSGGGTETASGKFEDGFGDNVLRITYTEEPESADPARTTADYILMMNCGDTLVRTEQNDAGENVTVEALAEKYEVSGDGLTYSFTLRDGIKFHNGEPVTSDDVLYTVDRMLDPERASRNSEWMDMIKGAQDVLDDKAKTVNDIGIVVKDDKNFDIILEQAYAPFLASLSTPAWIIINREAGEKADEAGGGAVNSLFGSDPAYHTGCGPFVLKEWVLNDHLYLETYPDYYRGASALDGIVIKIVGDADTERMMFDSGQIDIFDLDHAMDQIPNYMATMPDNIVTKQVLGTSYLSINEAIEPFQDVKVRKALQMAIDRDLLCETLYYGVAAVPAYGFFAEGLPGYTDLEPIPYDPEAAKALLKEAGYEKGFDMEIVQTSTSPDDQAINEVIQNAFQQIGINCKITQMDSAQWYDIRAVGESPMYRTSWTADFNDPDNFIYVMYNPSANVARSWNYQNQEAIDRIVAARYMTDPEARVKEYEALEQLVIRDDAAMIPLWHKVKIRVIQDRVKGFVPMWAGYGDCCYYGTSLDL